MDRLRTMAHVGLIHTALFLGLWLWSVVVYACVFATHVEGLWLGIDLGLVAVAGFVALRRPDLLGFQSLGAHRRIKLLGLAMLATLAVVIVQRIIPDWNMVALDESNYLMTLREERIITDGLLPFNVRWLVPFFGGRWNILPVADMEAIKAINFGAFVVTAYGLILLLVRLGAPLWLACTSPVFLLSSYLGIYGAQNRLVLDPSNYAFYVLLFHTLLRREHSPYFAAILLVDALNAEKAVYWIPVFVLVDLIRTRSIIDTVKLSAITLGPTVLYMGVLWLNLTASRLEANLCFENLHLMSFTNLGGKITDNVRVNNFQTLWMPFGSFTVFALAGFLLDERRHLKPVALLVIPIFIQAVIACDTDRMLAYSFIVYLPFGFFYLTRALREIPRAVGVAYVTAFTVWTALEHFYFAILELANRRAFFRPDVTRMGFSAIEIALVGSFVFLHVTVFRKGPPDGEITD